MSKRNAKFQVRPVPDKSSLAVLAFLALLLSANAGSFAEEPVPWHVKEADVRIPVTVDVDEAVLRMPPQVYLADLKPREAKALSFDPKTKAAVRRDIRPADEKAKMIAKIKEQCKKTGQKFNPAFYKPNVRAKGSATFSLRPEYKWFSFGRPWGNRDHVHVFVDGEQIGARAVGREAPYILALPPGAKTLRIEADTSQLSQAGFITRHPAAARATFCLPGRDPTALIPLVYDLSGKQVGCRILWAHPEEPMSIVFDATRGEKQYLVYLVDRAKKPSRLDWAPEAGLILETRYMDRYDPQVETLEGFLKLWDGTDFIAGKSVPYIARRHNRVQSIHHGFLPFRSMAGNTPNYRETPQGAPLALSRYTGFFYIPQTQEYDFYFMAWPGGYLLIDNEVVAELPYEEARKRYQGVRQWGKGTTQKRFSLKLERGLRRLDFLQYGSAGRFYASLAWGMPGSAHVFGTRYRVWEPLAEATAGPVARRSDALSASFHWRYAGQWLGEAPTDDVVLYAFNGKLFPERDDAVFRWRFDDGHTAEGKEVQHHFFAPGTRTVELDVLDEPGGKVIARAAGTVHVHVNWSHPAAGDPAELANPIAQREEEFTSVTPIEEVVSLYAWSLQNNWWERRSALGAALAGRIDELVAGLPYTRLLELGRSLAEPAEARHDAVERLLRMVMDRAPEGGDEWKSAATVLADIFVSVRGEPEKGLELLDKVQKARPIVDLTSTWRTAQAKQWYPSAPDSGQLAGETEDLDWSEPSYLSFDAAAEGGRGTWVMNDFQLPASRQGTELVFDLRNAADGGMLWFNGRRITGPLRGGELVIPAGLQRYDAENRFLALFQPIAPPDFFAGRPKLNFSHTAAARRNRITVPMALHTSASLDQKGANYAYYEGEWPIRLEQQEGFPDLDAMEPIREGTLTNLTIAPATHEWASPPPFHVTTFDLSARRRDSLFAMKFTGYVKVSAGVHQFTLTCGGGGSSRLLINSKLVINNESPFPERPARGDVYLAEGIHSVTAIYLQRAGELWMKLTTPDTSVSAAEVLVNQQRIEADALLVMGKEEKAKEILLNLKPAAWPLAEQKEWQLAGDLRRIRRWAKASPVDLDYALDRLDQWLRDYPMLRTVPAFMIAKIEALAEAGDYDRAFTLAKQMRGMDMNQSQREELMLVQVEAMVKAGEMDAAGEVYEQLKETAPYSTATVGAREAIKEAVLGK